MTYKVNSRNGGAIEVRIENGKIAEFSYIHNQKVTAPREEKEQIQFWMKSILEDDVDAFKAVLGLIKADEEYFPYGKSLLDAKKEAKVKAMLDYRKECDRRLRQMQEEVDKYAL